MIRDIDNELSILEITCTSDGNRTHKTWLSSTPKADSFT